MQVQWYPGHMAKTRRMIKEHIPLVDVVLELTDARAPFSTHVPDLDKLAGSKKLVVVFNKADLADESVTHLWIDKFKEMNLTAIDVDTPGKRNLARLVNLIKQISGGNPMRPTRCMVVGVPNVGKSSIINQMAGRKGAKTGNLPGITRGKMWLKVDKKLELLDTPGILWPKFEDRSTGIKLAILGSIKEELLNIEELSLILIRYLSKIRPQSLISRYKVDPGESPREILNQVAKNRGFLLSGGLIDTERSARALLNEFRQGKLGRISLERPDEEGGFWENISNHDNIQG